MAASDKGDNRPVSPTHGRREEGSQSTVTRARMYAPWGWRVRVVMATLLSQHQSEDFCRNESRIFLPPVLHKLYWSEATEEIVCNVKANLCFMCHLFSSYRRSCFPGCITVPHFQSPLCNFLYVLLAEASLVFLFWIISVSLHLSYHASLYHYI